MAGVTAYDATGHNEAMYVQQLNHVQVENSMAWHVDARMSGHFEP